MLPFCCGFFNSKLRIRIPSHEAKVNRDEKDKSEPREIDHQLLGNLAPPIVDFKSLTEGKGQEVWIRLECGQIYRLKYKAWKSSTFKINWNPRFCKTKIRLPNSY